jgi:hypothetical protein
MAAHTQKSLEETPSRAVGAPASMRGEQRLVAAENAGILKRLQPRGCRLKPQEVAHPPSSERAEVSFCGYFS